MKAHTESPFFYLVSLQIDRDIAQEWRQWMEETHIPDVIDTGCFEEAWICAEPEANTATRLAYYMIYRAPSRQSFERYQSEFAAELQADHTARYDGKFNASRALCDAIGQITP